MSDNKAAPLISVIMPIKNCGKYIDAALVSVLEQDIADFEVLIVDDYSTDDSWAKLEEWIQKDERIIATHNSGVPGLSNALNLGLSLARGRYVARMDADDISLRQRFRRQVEKFEQSESLDIVGSYIELMDEYGGKKAIHREPVTHSQILFHTMFGTPFAHPTVMIRKDFLRKTSIKYREMPAQDYDMWVRMLRSGARAANIPEVLLRYRVYGSSDSFARANEHVEMAHKLAWEQRQWLTRRAWLGARYCDGRLSSVGHALITENPVKDDISDKERVQEVLHLLSLSEPRLQNKEEVAELRNLIVQRGRSLGSFSPRRVLRFLFREIRHIGRVFVVRKRTSGGGL